MPRKTFTAGEVLAAADVNTFLSNEITLTSSTATALTVETADRYKTLVMTSASDSTVTFATTTAFEPGERIDILQDGAGTVTINTDGTDTTLSGRGTTGTAYTIGQQFDAVSVVCVAENSYRIIGNAEAV
jgi:phage-related protein